ncbi:MAG: hypothetical protein ACI9B9_001430 [Halioglobus sp.]|jgi:hypothetical protein
MSTTLKRMKFSGVALPLVMIFLTMLAVMAASALRSGITEYQIAGNDRFREAAFQRAQGIISRAANDVSRFPLTSELGIIACTHATESSSCVPAPIESTEPSVVDAAQSAEIFYEVERMPPMRQRGFSLREQQYSVSSSLAYDAALFEIRVLVDGSAGNLGSASVARGIAILTPSLPGNSAQ